MVIIISASALGFLSLPKPDPIPAMMDMDGLVEMDQKDYDYVRENVNHGIATREYKAVMDMVNGDLDRAIEIFNDPEYPEKFYDETGLSSLTFFF